MKNKLTVVFLSNFFNHHQKPFSDAMFGILGDRYHFIETMEMTQERKSMGWSMASLPPYVISSEDFAANREAWQRQIDDADVVIFGSAPHDRIRKRIRKNQLTFLISERPLKKGRQLHRYPDRLIRWHRWYPQSKNIHLLCASAYAAGDYARFFLFRSRSYKWGYFPLTRNYPDVEELIRTKRKNSLIWVARFIDWKHPELAVEVAKRLKRDGYSFTLEMIGNGLLLEEMRQLVRAEGLSDMVSLPGAMTPEEVRKHMEAAQIHLFTSDQQEGWGAVLNEAMNSGCVSIADKAIGAAPYLIEDGKNGFLYSGIDELYEKVRYLLDHSLKREAMAKKACRTITEDWNAETAAKRFLTLAEQLMDSDVPRGFVSGICSKAE